MFALSEDDLRTRILDCPGGAASFVAEAGALGLDALAADPAYSEDPVVLGDTALREVGRGESFLREHAAFRLVWTWFDAFEQHREVRSSAARAFAADIVARPDRYVSGSLPHLPFADDSFDLVLSSHLLFTYGERLDASFHLAAMLELARVSRWQVRLFPVVLHADGERYPLLDQLRAQLAEHGITSRLQKVGYEFQRDGNETLVLEV